MWLACRGSLPRPAPPALCYAAGRIPDAKPAMTSLDAQRWQHLRRLLDELVELAPPAREKRLDALDGETAAELRSLLAAGSQEASLCFEEAVAAGAAAVLGSLAEAGSGEAPVFEGAEHEIPSLAGQEVGPWRLERLLGHGGMAEVWEARRVDGQFEQTVAVKLLKRGMDSEELVRRFLRERQILAHLDHPGIARLFDGGLAPDGRPYFVLERVEGEPITEWCAHRHLGIRERLGLIIACCGALAAAHRQLVVHRDLKPSNILVNADGQVKLLDFGIAKLLASDGEDDRTHAEVRVLTPAYAAPEQILGEPVSTGTDVYALGVVAYQLLTGRLPHRRGGLRAIELAVAAHSESIVRPSTAVLAAVGEESAALPSDPQHVARQLRGDLDAILLTALRREPERRYSSIVAFADDCQRFLDGRPVSARADSLGYRTARFVGRHRLSLAAAALAVLSLVAGLLVAVSQARRADAAAVAERAAAAAARAETTRAEAMNAFLTDVFTAADPEGRRAADLTAGELVQQGAARIDERLAAQPATRAQMLHVLGNVQYRLGLYDAAQPLLERALALRRALRPRVAVDIAASAAALGVVYHRQGRSADGAKLLEEALALHQAAGPRSRLEVAKDLNNLANAYKALGRTADARAAFERAIAILDRTPDGDPGLLARVLNNYGLFLTRFGDRVAARDALERALVLHERTSGPDSALVSGTLGNLAEIYIHLDQVDRAVAATRRALAISRKTYGPGHYETGLAQNEVGWALLAAHRPAEARQELEGSIAILRAAVGDQHRSTAYPYRNLGRALAETGHPGEAIVALRHAERIWVATLGPDSFDLASVYVLLGPLLVDRGQGAEGERLLERNVELLRAAKSPSLGSGWLTLARARLHRCRLDEAREAFAAAESEVATHRDADWVADLPGFERELANARCGGRARPS